VDEEDFLVHKFVSTSPVYALSYKVVQATIPRLQSKDVARLLAAV